MARDKVEQSPNMDSTVYADSLFCCNNCGVAFKPTDKVRQRDKSHVNGAQHYLVGECPACNADKPTLIEVDERWGAGDASGEINQERATANNNQTATSD